MPDTAEETPTANSSAVEPETVPSTSEPEAPSASPQSPTTVTGSTASPDAPEPSTSNNDQPATSATRTTTHGSGIHGIQLAAVCLVSALIGAAAEYCLVSPDQSHTAMHHAEDTHSQKTTTSSVDPLAIPPPPPKLPPKSGSPDANASFDGKWGDASAGGQTGFFLFLKQNGKSINGWYLAQETTKGKLLSDAGLDLDRPPITGTISGSTAEVKFHSPLGAIGNASIELDDDQLFWTIKDLKPGSVGASRKLSKTTFLPEHEALGRDLEPKEGYWAISLVREDDDGSDKAEAERHSLKRPHGGNKISRVKPAAHHSQAAPVDTSRL